MSPTIDPCNNNCFEEGDKEQVKSTRAVGVHQSKQMDSSLQ